MRNRIINIKKDVGFALNIPDIFENKQTTKSEISDTTVRHQDTRPQAARTSTMHVFE